MRKSLALIPLTAVAASALPSAEVAAAAPTISPLLRILLSVGVLLVFVLITWLILRRLVSLRNELAEVKAARHAAELVGRMLVADVPITYEIVEELIDSSRREFSVQLRRLTVADLLEDVQATILQNDYILPRQKGELLENLRELLDIAQKRDAKPRKQKTIKGFLKECLAEAEEALKSDNPAQAKSALQKLKKATLRVYRFGAAFNPLYDALTLARKHPGVAFFAGLIYLGLFLGALFFVWSL